ncbi:hypothetical protein ABBQ32_003586 [Trebouxia sp. C0010 RCD-2024]
MRGSWRQTVTGRTDRRSQLYTQQANLCQVGVSQVLHSKITVQLCTAEASANNTSSQGIHGATQRLIQQALTACRRK